MPGREYGVAISHQTFFVRVILFKNVLFSYFPNEIVLELKLAKLSFGSGGSLMLGKVQSEAPQNIHCKRDLLDTHCHLLFILFMS